MTEDEMRSKEYSLAAIDCDILAYQASSAVQKVYYRWVFPNGHTSETFDSAKACKNHKVDAEEFLMEDTSEWQRESWTVIGTAEEAIKAVDNKINYIMHNVKAKKYQLFLTGKGNHRIAKAKLWEYKGNRKNTPKPEHLHTVRGHLINHWGAKVVDNLEADDVLSIIGCQGWYACPDNPKTAIVTIDWDNMNSPGVIYNHNNDEFVFNTEDDANRYLFIQILCGDAATDNIQGLPMFAQETRERYSIRKSKGVGEKSAEKVIEGSEGIQEMYRRTIECYQEWYGDIHTFTTWDGREITCTAEDMMDETAELVFLMRRKGEYWSDFKRGIL